MTLLIAGGALDPHNERVAEVARRGGVDVRMLRVGPEHFPAVRVELPSARLWVDGDEISPSALWLRHDVFHAVVDPRDAVRERASAWFEAMAGWAALRPDVRWPNRGGVMRRVNKLAQLGGAAAAGFRVPEGYVTNDVAGLGPEGWVVKPVRGGGLCVPLAGVSLGSERVGVQPAFVQRRLVGPEVRAYVIGDDVMAWEIETDVLDHRAEPDCAVRRVAFSESGRLVGFARSLGLDFAAADFKRCPDTGELVFLEINTQPMWTAYDADCKGELAERIVAWLVG